MNLLRLMAGNALRLWRAAAAILLFIGPAHADSFPGWPEGWKRAYERFEKYNADRAQYFPRANLVIFPDGQIEHSVQLFKDTTEHLTLNIFTEGRQALGILDSGGGLDAQNRQRLFPPQRYTVALLSCGLAGYQYLYPFAWYEVSYRETGTPQTASSERKLAVRPIEPPQPPEDYWPNERIFQFLDFHIFPHHYPSEIAEENAKVTPSIKLSLTNSGTVERDLLDKPLEKLLKWRIYYNGRLVEKGPATDRKSISVGRGSGTYQVLIGVEGPGGFMPVSNLLEFPLFPEKSGRFVVFPAVTNPERFPDFLLEILTAEQRAETLSAYPPAKYPDRFYNLGFVYIPTEVGPFANQKSEDLYYLWLRWAWELNSSMGSNSLKGLDKVKDRPTRP